MQQCDPKFTSAAQDWHFLDVVLNGKRHTRVELKEESLWTPADDQ